MTISPYCARREAVHVARLLERLMQRVLSPLDGKMLRCGPKRYADLCAANSAANRPLLRLSATKPSRPIIINAHVCGSGTGAQ